MSTLGPPTVAPGPPSVLSSSESSLSVEWAEATLGDHDAPVTGYILTWRAVDARPTAGDVELMTKDVDVGMTTTATISVWVFFLQLLPLSASCHMLPPSVCCVFGSETPSGTFVLRVGVFVQSVWPRSLWSLFSSDVDAGAPVCAAVPPAPPLVRRAVSGTRLGGGPRRGADVSPMFRVTVSLLFPLSGE